MKSNAPHVPGLPERFKPLKHLHKSSHVEIVQAIDHDRGELEVALKLLRADGSHAEVTYAMFRRETEALKGLSHDGIVEIIDSFEVNKELLCIELELVSGGRTLAHLLEDVKTHRLAPPSMAWRLKTIDRLADAVSEAHRRDIIHRDLKPRNVLWNRDEDTLKLADFGIALVLALAVREPGGATLRNFFTPPYASPEQRLQGTARFASDVYSFGVLTAALLALREPGTEFTPAGLPDLLAPALEELRAGGVPEEDVEAVADVLKRALLDEWTRRPSLSELRSVLSRSLGSFVPRKEAAVVMSGRANERLKEIGFLSPAKIAADFDADLRVRLEQDDKGELLRIFGASLFAVLRLDGSDPDGATLRIVDAGQNDGPRHEAHRRNAVPCPIRVRIGTGSGAALLDFARDAYRVHTRRLTNELVECARLIVDIERERLPYFAIECAVDGGHPIKGRREERVGQASGYVGGSIEKVELHGGFRLRVTGVKRALAPVQQNVVRRRLEGGGGQGTEEAEEVEVFDDSVGPDWYALFDDPKDIDVLDDHGHMVGKVTGYDRPSNIIQVKTDKRRQVLQVGTFYVKSQQKERQLRQQEMAMDMLARGETARADMPALLAESSVHRMGENPWRELLQQSLVPKDRVRALVNRILASESVFCLQGPPGTGKTTIIAELVAQTLELEPRTRILVCAQANEAVANAIERIRKVRVDLGRDWIIVRDVRDEQARKEGKLAGFEKAYVEFRDRVLDRSTTAATGQDVMPAQGTAALESWRRSIEQRTQHVERDYRRLVQVWATTTARSTVPLQDVEAAYDLVIIDEAAKATVGEVLVPVVRARKLVLVGDQQQLPPFLEDTTREALQELGISEAQAKYSLFEHLMALLPAEHRDMLDMQFRMHPTIGTLVSRLFYDGKVKDGPGTDQRPLPAGDFNRAHRVLWVDVVGSDYKVGRTSRANNSEREVIGRLLQKLDEDAARSGWSRAKPLSVAVIAAYRGQADFLQRDLDPREGEWKALEVKAATVDSFQGREADVVLYSMVRSGDAKRDFIADGRRFNVALSRARSLLVLVGDKKGALGTARLKELLDMIPPENQVPADVLVPKPRSPGKPRR